MLIEQTTGKVQQFGTTAEAVAWLKAKYDAITPTPSSDLTTQDVEIQGCTLYEIGAILVAFTAAIQ